MEFLQARVPKLAVDFKQTTFEFEAKDVDPLDQMDMHKQIREMVYSTFTHTTLISSKMYLSLNNVQSQLKLEKISSLAKDKRIKYLDEMVIKAVFEPDNTKSMEEVIKKNTIDIESLRKKLKLPTDKYHQEKELGETELQKEEMLKLLVEQSAQIKEMEA